MADQLPTTKYYSNLGGVNVKASPYNLSTAQFLSLYNLDFDVPNALQKRPGSTYATATGVTAAVTSLYEFIKLSGASYVVAGSEANMYYLAGSNYTLLDSAWNNLLPTDMLTFVDKLWMANGQKWRWWDGASVLPVGLRCAPTPNYAFTSTAGASWMTVAGQTHLFLSGATYRAVGVWLGVSYVRNDGYPGPLTFTDFLANGHLGVVQIVGNVNRPIQSGAEFFGGSMFGAAGGQAISGFTGAAGLSAYALWLALDIQANNNDAGSTAGVGPSVFGIAGRKTSGSPGTGKGTTVDTLAGDISGFWDTFISSDLDTTKFYLYTLIPATTATFVISGLNWSNFVASAPQSYSGIIGDFFATYTPQYQEIHNNILFSTGFSQSPSLVNFSDIGAPESYQPDANFEVRTNDGDKVSGIVSYNGQLLLMKEFSFHRLIGDNADNFQLVQISNQYGCVNNNTIVMYDQKIAWLDRAGIIEYNGANHQIISTPVENIFRRMDIKSCKLYARGVHYPDRKQLWFGISIDAPTTAPFDQVPQLNNITVVYDYLVGAWTYFDGFKPASFALIKNKLARPTVWRGDYSGYIHYHGNSFYSDSNQGITCLLQTRFESSGENISTLWRRFFVDTNSVSGLTGTINGLMFSNYDSSTVRATFSVYQSAFQSRVEMGVQGKALSVQLSHNSASLPLLINGYALAHRDLRNV